MEQELPARWIERLGQQAVGLGRSYHPSRERTWRRMY